MKDGGGYLRERRVWSSLPAGAPETDWERERESSPVSLRGQRGRDCPSWTHLEGGGQVLAGAGSRGFLYTSADGESLRSCATVEP